MREFLDVQKCSDNISIVKKTKWKVECKYKRGHPMKFSRSNHISIEEKKNILKVVK